MSDFETLYWLVFAAFVLTLLALERVRAVQRMPVRIALRWGSNIGLFVLGALVSAVLLPIGIVAFAAQQPPGVMTGLGIPLAVQVVATFLLLDLWKYGEHRLFHAVPLLWRCHLVHHSDTAVDVTTTERHHPLEVLISGAVLMAVVVLWRPPAVALGLYLLAATGVALYSHANVRLPAAIDGVLRRVLVTPSVHAVHHSSLQPQTDSNFGMVLTLWDRVFGSFVDPSRTRIAHFGLDYFHRPDDTRLWRVLQQPFRFRRDLEYPARGDASLDAADGTAPDSTPALAPHARTALLAGLGGITLVLFATWPTVLDMMRIWSSGDAYQYAWLVVPMIVYVLGWHHDAGLRAVDPRPGVAGIPVAIAGAMIWAASHAMSLDVGEQAGLVVAMHGVALSTLGSRSYRRLFPVLALLFFMVPAGDLLQPGLRAFTVKAIEALAWAAGIPHSVDGFVMHIGTHRYIVVDECSGLAYVTLAGFLGYCFGLLLYGSFLRAAGMALVGALLGVLSNVIRVDAIVLIDWLRGSQMDLSAHGTLQWIMLFATLAALLYVLSRSRVARIADAVSTPGPPRSPAPNALRALAPAAAGLSAAVIAGVAWHALHGASDGSLPVTLPDAVAAGERTRPMAWHLDAAPEWASTRAAYVRGDGRWEITVIRANRIGAKPPEPLLAIDERAIWREKQVERDVACANRDCIAVRHTTWLRQHAQDLRHAYVAYDIDGSLTPSRLGARALHGWHRLLQRAGPPMLIAVTADTALDGADVALALRAAHAAVHSELPAD